ncbi:MAG: dienelactone hydrolase family protein [Gemmatimonadota bacterium]
MFTSQSSSRGAVSYTLIALLAAGVGALGTWVVQGGHRAAALDAVTTHGEWVYIKRGSDSIRAYVAYPERRDQAPGIIVIHEIFGLSDWEPTVVDRLAREGYVAIVPDLLSSRYGMTPANPDSGRKLVPTLEPDRITADLDATYAYLNGLPAVHQDEIGTIGFCWGGGQSFRYATDNPNLKAAVVCYGPPSDSAAMAKINARVLGVYGESDARIGATIPDADRIMKSLGKSYSYDTYAGTGHGFLRPGRQGSDGPQVESAWTRILAFYQETLNK